MEDASSIYDSPADGGAEMSEDFSSDFDLLQTKYCCQRFTCFIFKCCFKMKLYPRNSFAQLEHLKRGTFFSKKNLMTSVVLLLFEILTLTSLVSILTV